MVDFVIFFAVNFGGFFEVDFVIFAVDFVTFRVDFVIFVVGCDFCG